MKALFFMLLDLKNFFILPDVGLRCASFARYVDLLASSSVIQQFNNSANQQICIFI
jgi:hypothetical protein